MTITTATVPTPPPPTKRRQPSKALKRRVREAFDGERLQQICTMNDFSNYAERFDLEDSPRDGHKRFFYYQDNGSDILAIAHLDTVQDDHMCQITDTAAGLLATSGALDDRLGAYVILELLPKLGIKCDWLLTTDEEIGQSTAECFDTTKNYNWMFQFDRGGTDVVMYQYENDDLVEMVNECGARVGLGIFSDICLLEHLGCTGFNWGVGYEDYHSERSHAWLDDTFRMVARFVKFYQENATLSLPYKYEEEPDWAAAFVADAEMLAADCGHSVDVNDPSSYFEVDSMIMCASCGGV